METNNENSAIPDELLRRYSDFRRLGAGAMGEVYRAHDNNLDIDVAIKLLKTRQIAPEVAVRFQQEAKVASKLKHPNLVTLLDFGISAKGEPYLIMESVEGHSLADELEKRGALSIPEAFNILVQVCDGIEHAHRIGVIHRDLKPSNLMVCGDDLRNARIKVLDFGIAKLDDTNGGITKTGIVLGTPYYMSPEQFSNQNVDRRTDVYAAGTMLFRLLTNHHPFEGDTLLEIMQAKQEWEAPPITEAPGGEEIPHEVEEVVSKAVAGDPDRRYASMKEFQDALLLALDKIHIKLELQAQPQLEKRKLFNATALRLYAKITGLVLIGTLAIAVFYGVYLNNNNVPVADVGKPKWTESQKGTPINHDILSIENGEWKAKGELHDQDLVWLSQNAPQNCKALSLGVGESTMVQNKITKVGWAALGRIPIAKLSLPNCFLSDDDVMLISKNKNLRSLDLSKTGIGDKGVASLKNSKIEALWLRGNPRVTDNCIDTLVTMPNLKKLSVNDTQITDKGYEKISKIKKLEWLDLSTTKGTGDGLRYIGQMPRLEVLHIEGGPFGLNGIKNLSKLKLKSLSSNHDKSINDQCLIVMSKQWPNLESLHIASVSITRTGLECIDNFKQMKNLNLNANALKDDDVMPILRMPKIISLDLMLNPITDKTIERLVTIPTLRSVDLSECSVTQKGLHLLKDRKIVYKEFGTEGKDTAEDVMTDLLQGSDTF